MSKPKRSAVGAVAAMVAVAVTAAASADALAAEAQQIENAHYTAVVDPGRGGLLTKLTSKATGEVLIDNMRIYTDVGVLADGRYGYIGTGEGSCEKFAVSRQGDATVVEAEGRLVGKAAAGKPPLFYRCRTVFDQSATIRVSAAVKPSETKQVGGFLALSWYMPSMARWAVRTIEGLLRHAIVPGEHKRGRAFSHQWPLDPDRPLLLFVSRKGAELRIEGLRFSGRPAFTGPVIHGQSVFLCWIDGAPRQLIAGQWATLEFTLAVGAEDIRDGERG